jgi:hypothetical protein
MEAAMALIKSIDITTRPTSGTDRDREPAEEENSGSWYTWLKEGRQYMKAGCGKKGRFDNTIRYNLLAMAFEKFVMAILGYHMSLPMNHTITDLIEALEQFHPLDGETKDVLLGLEKKQEICSFEDGFTSEITDEDIRVMTETIIRFEALAERVCPAGKAPVMLPMNALPCD